MNLKKILLICLSVFCISLNAFSKTTYVFPSDPIDVIIPCTAKDLSTLELCIQSVRQYVKNVRRIIVISDRPITDSAEWFDEKLYPFSKEDVAMEIFRNFQKARNFLKEPNSRIGWIYQQLLKLYAYFVIPDVSPNLLVVDSDVIWLNSVKFMNEKNEPFFTAAHEYHPPYFQHMAKLLEGLHRANPSISGIAHHMLFQAPILEDLFQNIYLQHKTEPWKAICHCIDQGEVRSSSLSEYEIYFNFAILRSSQCHLRYLRWTNSHTLRNLEQLQKEGYIYAACHAWTRYD